MGDFTDGFKWVYLDNYEWISSNTTSLLNHRWVYTSEADINFDATDTVTSARSLYYTQNLNPAKLWNLNLGGNFRSIHCGFWFKNIINSVVGETRTENDPILTAYNSDGQQNFSLGLTYSGTLQCYIGGTESVKVPGHFTNDVWHYIEVFWWIHTSTGRIVIYVDDVEALDATGDTNNFIGRTKVDDILVGGYDSSSNNECRFENFWIRAGSLEESAPTFFGPMKIVTSTPDGDGNYSQWNSTASPTLYTEVDELADPDTATYVSTATSSNKASFTHSALGLGAGETIKCVGLQQDCIKPTLGGGAFRPFVRISGTDYFELERFPEDSFYNIGAVYWENDPSSSPASGWSEATVDAAEFGIEYVG